MADSYRSTGYTTLIQCPEISSSSDRRSDSFRYVHRTLFPSRRCSYRTNTSPNPDPALHNARSGVINVQPASRNPNNVKPCLSSLSTKTALTSVCAIFLCSVLLLSLVYMRFPHLQEHEKQHIKIPWNIEDAKHLGLVLNRFKDDHYGLVLMGVSLVYVFLQTFAIPGSLFLSIMSGFLFEFYIAIILVCTCSALGASLCFMLSQLLGRRLIWKYYPKKANEWAVIVNKHKDNLLNYVVFLRVTPFLPNWFINLTAPIVGVPLVPFALGTFLGVAPPSFFAIQAGQMLNELSSRDSAFTWTSAIWLGIFAIVSLIPIFLKSKLKRKFE